MISFKLALLWLLIVLLVAGLSSYFIGISFWAAALIVAIALVVNGMVTEIEDRLPGGFFKPKNDE